ncbi:MAG: hypothetical protein QRY71_00925 [Candidatus Rhabdochlamydia sp.]
MKISYRESINLIDINVLKVHINAFVPKNLEFFTSRPVYRFLGNRCKETIHIQYKQLKILYFDK